MKYEQYIDLIRSLEVSAARSRTAYEFKVLMLTVLGYAYFVGLILLLLAPFLVIGVGLIFAPGEVLRIVLVLGKLWWVIIPGLGFYFGFLGPAVRSITAKVPDPDGKALERSQAQLLFEFVDKTCKKLRAARPKQILVTDDFNASVVTMPRLGIFGQKVFLILGLPLMKALSVEQFKAVVAHEIGHISGKHGNFAKWAYQMREAWGRLIDSQEMNEHKFASLYKGFVDRFFPYFTAYSFVLAREHEKDADRDAAEIVGAKPLSEALILLETKTRAIDEVFWREVHQENLTSEEPSEKMFSRMLGSLAFYNDDRDKESLTKAVAVPTDFNDTHPSLADRLRLLGYWVSGDLPPLPRPSEKNAADEFLGPISKGLTDEFDDAWQVHAVATWKERHEHFREAGSRLTELEAKHSSEPLDLEELREMARLIAERDGWLAAASVIEETAERFPESGFAQFNLGYLRLLQDDENGLQYLRTASELDDSLRWDSNQVSFEYLRSKGRLDEAKQYATAIDEQSELYEKAQKERSAVYPQDKFGPHDLTEEAIAAIPAKLAGLDEITALYAANKVVEHLPEHPFRVFFVGVRKKDTLKNRNDANPTDILKIVSERLDNGDFHFFVVLTNEWAGVGRELDKIPGAKIYEK